MTKGSRQQGEAAGETKEGDLDNCQKGHFAQSEKRPSETVDWLRIVRGPQ